MICVVKLYGPTDLLLLNDKIIDSISFASAGLRKNEFPTRSLR